MALTSNRFSITAIHSHSPLLLRANSETVLLLFWTFGIFATSSQSRLDPPQFTSSSFWPRLQLLSGNVCIYTDQLLFLRWETSIWKRSSKAFFLFGEPWHLERIVLRYSQRKIYPVALPFCQLFSIFPFISLAKERPGKPASLTKCFFHLLDQGHRTSELISHYGFKILKWVYPVHSFLNGTVYWSKENCET